MGVIADVRAGVRLARRSPLVSLGGILCIALGIGATTALYGVLEHIVLHPLAYPNPGELVMLRDTNRSRQIIEVPLAFAEFDALRREQDRSPFRAIAAYQMGTVALSQTETPERLDTGRVSDGFFDILGAIPMLGRTLGSADVMPGAAPAAVISERLWRRQFNADVNVIGRAVRLNNRAATIVGVLPATFRDPYGFEVDCWVPLAFDNPTLSRPDVRTLTVIARLKPDVTLDAARTAIAGMASKSEGWEIGAVPLIERMASVWKAPAITLFAAVLLVLVIACIDVATLLLARTSERGREIAVRVSLGARPRQIARQLTVETLVLAVPGALGGLLCAFWLQRLLIWLRPAFLSRLDALAIDPTALTVAIAATSLTVAVCTSLPLWHALRGPRADLLRISNGSGSSGNSFDGGRGGALRRSLSVMTVAEIALGLALLVTATVVTRDLLDRLPRDVFDWHDKLTIRVTLPGDRYATREQRLAFMRQVSDQMRLMPGVAAVAQASIVPFDRYMLTAFVSSATSRDTSLVSAPIASYAVVSPEYFDTLKIRVKAGRTFTPHDAFGATGAFIVTESLAKRLWPSADGALHQPLSINVFNPSGSLRGDVKRDGEIVGIVPDIRNPTGSVDEPQLLVYAPIAQHTMPFARIIISAPHAGALARDARVRLGKIDPALVPDEVVSIEEMLGQRLELGRFYMALTQMFAGAGLTLAIVGVYAVTGFMVHRRRHELAIRIALGASPRQVFAHIALNGAAVILAGLILGSAAAFVARRLIAALIAGSSGPAASTINATSFGLAAAAIVLTAGAAVAIGALRAVKLDPLRALREP